MKCTGKRAMRMKSYELTASSYSICPLRYRCINYSVAKPTIEAKFKKKSCPNFVNKYKNEDDE